MQIYVVKTGDVLWRIARNYNVSIESIVSVNQMANPNRLIVGEALVIPTPDTNVHIVQPGETLWLIASRYGTTVDALAAENHITRPELIYAGQVLYIPKPIIEVNGYVTQGGDTGRQIAQNLGRYLTYICTFSYRVQADGNLSTFDDTALLNAERTQGVSPLMTITNFAGARFSSELAHTVLTNTTVQNTLISNIIRIMGNKGYRGLNIDFEYVFPEDREAYNTFLRLIARRLHDEGYSVSTALAPKASANQIGLLYEAHDYPVHGQVADFVVIMTYEYGWAGGPPWAISPVNEVRRALNYAVSAIPRSKILMGMPTYGRDWKLPYVSGQSLAGTLSPTALLARAAQYGVSIQYNTLYQAPFYRYVDSQGATHEVWFEDARSAQAKYNIVKEYGLRGVSYWELLSPFPQNWPVLASNFRTRKYA